MDSGVWDVFADDIRNIRNVSMYCIESILLNLPDELYDNPLVTNTIHAGQDNDITYLQTVPTQYELISEAGLVKKYESINKSMSVRKLEFIRDNVKYDKEDCFFMSIKHGRDKFNTLNKGIVVTGNMVYTLISEYEPYKYSWLLPLLIDEYDVPCNSTLVDAAYENESHPIIVLNHVIDVIKTRKSVNVLQLFRRVISDSYNGHDVKCLVDMLIEWISKGIVHIDTKHDHLLCDAVDDDREDILTWICEHGHAKNIWSAINMAILQNKTHLLDVLFAHL